MSRLGAQCAVAALKKIHFAMIRASRYPNIASRNSTIGMNSNMTETGSRK